MDEQDKRAPEGPGSQAGAPAPQDAPLREDEVTEGDRLDDGDLSESERLPGDS